MKVARVTWVGFALFSVIACSAVYVDEPIGTDVVRVEENDWEGTWVAADGDTVVVGVRDRDGGVLWMAGVEESDGDLEIESLTVHLRDATHDGRERLFFSVEDDDRYVWGLVVRDQEYAVVYAPDLDRFRALVREGRLPGQVGEEGEIGGGDVYLGKLSPDHLEMILAANGGFFVWDDPYVMRRVAR